jgi:chaperonin GroEL (HSP60 family)
LETPLRKRYTKSKGSFNGKVICNVLLLGGLEFHCFSSRPRIQEALAEMRKAAEERILPGVSPGGAARGGLQFMRSSGRLFLAGWA